MIKDKFGRPILNLRISVTQRCNLHCLYCHHEGQEKSVGNSNIEMTPQEIVKIAKIGLNLGINKVKLTGGEPLVREDIIEIVKGLDRLGRLKNLSMTTNGALLARYADDLKENGLNRVNINIPSLNDYTYTTLTGGYLKNVLNGIDAAIKAGLHPVKLNMLVLRDINDNEIFEMIDFARDKSAILQIIELEPINVARDFYEKHHDSLDDIESKLEKLALKIETRSDMQNRRVYYLQNAQIEVIHPIENTEFCLHCTRIRITSDGKLKPCLMRNDNLIDLITPLRNGESDNELKQLFLQAISNREPYYKRCLHPVSA
jgi:cyclic pyranopterin phosphate synthase